MRILIIANNFPPLNSSPTIRILNYVNHLAKVGHKVTVITVKLPKDALSYDEGLENKINKKIDVINSEVGYFYKLGYSKKKENNKEGEKIKNRFLYKIIKGIFFNYIAYPDLFFLWRKKSKKEIKQLFKKEKFDVMVSFHESPSSHLLALDIKKKYHNVEWISFWGDPWYHDNSRKRNFLFKKLDKYFEKKIVEKSDKLIFASKYTMDLYRCFYKIKKEKLNFCERGYDKELLESIKKENEKPKEIVKNKINIVYTGAIHHPLRNIIPLTLALEELDKKTTDKFNFIFIGNMTEVDRNHLSKFSFIKILKQMSFINVSRYMINSDVLLLIGNKNSTQIPGKLFEYLGCNKYILTILGDEKDPIIEFYKNFKLGDYVLNEKEGIKNSLKRILENKDLELNNKECIEKYSWTNIAQDFEEKLLKGKKNDRE